MEKIEEIKNIIPHILQWAQKNQEPFFAYEGEKYFDYDFRNIIDWEKVEQANILAISSYCNPFNGNYQSDEVHDYHVLFHSDVPVALYFKIADKSDPQIFWFTEQRKNHVLSELVSKFLLVPDNCCVLDCDISANISTSCYQQYIKYNGDIYAAICDPTWGGIPSNDDDYVMEINDANEVISMRKIRHFTMRKKHKDSWRNDMIKVVFEDGCLLELDYNYNADGTNYVYVTKIKLSDSEKIGAEDVS